MFSMEKNLSQIDQPFIFMSYSHKDDEVVIPIYQKLLERGCNIWIDRQIRIGSVWRKVVAHRIKADSCKGMLCFLSKKYVESRMCIKELDYAQRKGKKIIIIRLDQEELPPEYEMFYDNSEQTLRIHEYGSVDQLVSTLCDCEEVSACLGSREQAQQPKTIEAAQTPVKIQSEHNHNGSPVFPSPSHSSRKWILMLLVLVTCIGMMIPLLRSGAEDPVPPESHPVMNAGNEAIDPPASTGGEVPVATESHPTVNTGNETPDPPASTGADAPDDTEIQTFMSISNEVIDDEYLKRFSLLDGVRSIVFKECQFTNVNDTQSAVFPDSLTELTFKGCSGLNNIGFLQYQDGLVLLRIHSSGLTDQDLLFPLPASLKTVDLSGNPLLSDIGCLSGCVCLGTLLVNDTNIGSLGMLPPKVLHTLDISRTSIKSLEGFSDFESLRIIRGEELELKTLAQLAKLGNLVEIDFSDCSIRSSAELLNCTRLERLDLSGNQLVDLDQFFGCTRLSEVNLSGNRLQDLEILKKSAEHLKILNLSNNPVKYDQITDLLDVCKNLTELYLDGIPLSLSASEPQNGLESLSRLSSLRILSLSGCELYNIQSMPAASNLVYLDLSNNHICETQYIPKQNRSLKYNLNNNPLSQVYGLSNCFFNVLSLYAPDADEIDLSSSIEGGTLIISSNVDQRELIEIGGNFYKVYIVDCPLDRRVEIEDSIGIYKVEWITEAEVDEVMQSLGFAQ